MSTVQEFVKAATKTKKLKANYNGFSDVRNGPSSDDKSSASRNSVQKTSHPLIISKAFLSRKANSIFKLNTATRTCLKLFLKSKNFAVKYKVKM